MRSADMDEFVARVRAESDILAVVSPYVPLKKKGNRYWGCCPFHQEKTPSFSIVPSDGFFYCFGCHVGGDAFKFLSLVENISYFEAIKLQAEKLGIPFPERARTAAEQARAQKLADMQKVLSMAQVFFHNCLLKTGYGAAAKAYLSGRGISMETISAFGLGCAPNAWDKLSTAFQKRGVSPELLTACGLAAYRQEKQGLYDRFRDRVIIPIADERGRVVGFGGRVLGDGQPKYLNTPETALFNKRKLLFGLDRAHRAMRQEDLAIIVEGYMDAISVFGAGVQNVVASLGTAFTPEHGKRLLRYTPNLYFCYDSDEAGKTAVLRASAIAVQLGANVRVMAVPDGKDPDEFIRKRGAGAFRALVKAALPLADYRLRDLLGRTDHQSLESRLHALAGMLPVLAALQNAAELDAYVTKTAQELQIDEGAVRSELRRFRRGNVPPQQPAQAAQRQAIPQADSAVRRAGRIVVRAAWKDAGALAHLASLIPLAEFPVAVHREILECIAEAEERGESLGSAEVAQSLGEEAALELSRALVETAGETVEIYEDSMKVLRRAYYQQLYDKHRRRADEMERDGDARFLQELAESQRILEEGKRI